ncbi:immature colon carcinoma transcript 1 [Babesia ovis]|uniref:Immature colon carcinoma transcript 1 n=1 Tax=Babesia ovis TaxID=5869 RepID=A0A9W5WTF9_BABOV|nr:immature colon carcinoma transcript 1 [Babesia ovis]
MLAGIRWYQLVAIRGLATKVPVGHIKINTSRSSGPGGQSVNKSETKVQARFNVEVASWMTDATKEKFRTLYKNRITQTGDFIVECDGKNGDSTFTDGVPDFASQEQNRKACIEKLNEAVQKAEQYEEQVHMSFLEQIQQQKTSKEIEQYNKKRRENKRKLKRLGHKTLADF